MASVFDITKKQVDEQQSNRSNMIQSMEMPESAGDEFVGMSTAELEKVNLKQLDAEAAKKWAKAMEDAKEAEKTQQAAPVPAAPAPTAAPQGTAAMGGPAAAAAPAGVALL